MITAKRLIAEDFPLPLLMEVVEDPRKLTLRVYEELVDGAGVATGFPASQGNTSLNMGLHVANTLGLEAGTRQPIDGADLAERFAGRTFVEIGASTLDMDAERGVLCGNEWSDHGLWVFPVDQAVMTPGPVINHVCENVARKALPRRASYLSGQPGVLFMAVPFHTCDIAGSSLLLRCHPDYGCIGNVTLEPGNALVVDTLFATFELVSGGGEIQADATQTVTIRAIDQMTGAPVADAACDVYLEATGGYLPHVRVPMAGGAASFRVAARGLVAGETFKVKVGYRLFSGVLDVPFTVV